MSDVIEALVEREYAFGFHSDLDTDLAPKGRNEDVVRLISDDPTASQRWRPSVPLLAAGSVGIVAGGLAAAVTDPTDWGHGSWVAAFLVLVTGVAQIGLGACQARLAPVAPNVPFVAVECALWNVGCVAVVAGTLLSAPIAVIVGGGSLVATLGMSTFAIRGTGGHPLVLLLYRALLIVLLVSIPIGTALAWARH